MNDLHKAAAYYASIGWHVLPVWGVKADGSCECGSPHVGELHNIGKHPLTTRGQHDATTDLQQITAWWTQHPNANIGIALAPSNLIAFDIDKPESYAAWGEIEAKHGEPATTVQVSGSGCHHVLFQRPPFAIRGSYDKRITLRGNNFIVAAPSRHKSGGTYHWQDGKAPWDVAPAPMAAALADELKRPEQAPVDANHDYPAASPEIMRAAQEALTRHGPEIKGVSPQGHTRVAWGILVNDFALSPKEAEPLIRAYNAQCNPPWPIDKLFSSPCRAVQAWNNPRGALRDLMLIRQDMASYVPAPVLPPNQRMRAQRIIDVAAQKDPPVQFFKTGIDQFDTLSGGGVAARRVCGVVGPPSGGKSAFVTSIGLELQRQLPVLHFSTELPRKEVQIRWASPIVGFPWRDGLKGLIPDDIVQRAVNPLNVWIIGSDDYDRNDPIASLRFEALAVKAATGKAPCIIVDYVQMLARGSAEQVRHKVGELTLHLRMLAQELDCPIIAVFSTSRAYYGGKQMDNIRASGDPTSYLAAAKESGEIEYDCGTILYLDLDKMAVGQPKPCLGALARCRDGEIGMIGLRANLATGLWTGDAAAVSEMGSDERVTKRAGETLDADCKRLVEVITKMPGRPWSEMSRAMGVNGMRVTSARAKLLEEGAIYEDTRPLDPMTKKPQKGTTYVLREQISPPRVPLKEGV